ncbi:MAG: hypothetical protein ACRD6W_10015, partial [Nitrososphaerales archaeon]
MPYVHDFAAALANSLVWDFEVRERAPARREPPLLRTTPRTSCCGLDVAPADLIPHRLINLPSTAGSWAQPLSSSARPPRSTDSAITDRSSQLFSSRLLSLT